MTTSMRQRSVKKKGGALRDKVVPSQASSLDKPSNQKRPKKKGSFMTKKKGSKMPALPKKGISRPNPKKGSY